MYIAAAATSEAAGAYGKFRSLVSVIVAIIITCCCISSSYYLLLFMDTYNETEATIVNCNPDENPCSKKYEYTVNGKLYTQGASNLLDPVGSKKNILYNENNPNNLMKVPDGIVKFFYPKICAILLCLCSFFILINAMLFNFSIMEDKNLASTYGTNEIISASYPSNRGYGYGNKVSIF